MNAHLLGLATWTELEATVGSIVAATLRNDGAEVEALRVKMHDIIDQHVDAKIEGIALMRADIEREFKG